MLYKKNSPTVDAVRFTGSITPELEALLPNSPCQIELDGTSLVVHGPRGRCVADVGDFIVRSADCQLSVEKPEAFLSSYTVVSAPIREAGNAFVPAKLAKSK